MYKRQEQRIGDTSNALAAQKEKLGATAKSLNEAGVGTDNLGAKSQDLADKLNTLRAKEEAAAESAEEYGDKGTSSIEAVSQAFAAAKVYEALEQIKDAYMDCINSAGDFEASMSNVEALSGASGDQLQALTDKAKEMGATTKFTAGESADALSYMALALSLIHICILPVVVSIYPARSGIRSHSSVSTLRYSCWSSALSLA